MQVFLIYMVPHLSLLYYTNLPYGPIVIWQSQYLNYGAILLKTQGLGIHILWTHISSFFCSPWARSAHDELLWSVFVRRPCVVNFLLYTTSPPKPLDGLWNNFTGRFLGWPSTKIAQIVPLCGTRWPPELKIEKPLNDFFSWTRGWILK